MDATSWNERYSQADQVWPSSPNRWVVHELEGHVPGRALDLGAGEGRNAIWLAEQGWSVTAVDFAEQALVTARARAAAVGEELGTELDITWVRSDLFTYEIPAGAYDLVLATYVHVVDYERRELLRSWVRALAPGGTLLVVGHDTTNLTEGHGGPQDVDVLFTAADLEADLQDHLGGGALVVERTGRVAREVETPEGTVVAWDALFHARRRVEGQGGFGFSG